MTTSVGALAFEPIHKAHAIEEVGLVVSFDRGLTDEKLKAAKTVIGEPEGLPGRKELRGFSIALGLGGGATSPQLVGGYGYSAARPDGVIEKELDVLRSSMTFRSKSYIRWANTWGDAKKYFSPLLPIYIEQAKLTQVSLTYVDKFVPTDPSQSSNVAQILMADSPFLASEIFTVDDLWHCHTGRFKRIDQIVKRLVTVNVDFVTELHSDAERNALAITTVVSNIYNQPSYEPFDATPSNITEVVENCFTQLHLVNKEVVLNIISESMAKRINLAI